METKTKKTYESPTVEITHVVMEDVVAASTVFTGEPVWKKDETPDAPLDGDIWVDF